MLFTDVSRSENGRYTKSARHWPIETSGKTVLYVKYNSLRRLAGFVRLQLTFIVWKNYNRMNLHFTGLEVDAGYPKRATKSRPFIWASDSRPFKIHVTLIYKTSPLHQRTIKILYDLSCKFWKKKQVIFILLKKHGTQKIINTHFIWIVELNE